jgi:hypothetical protein
MHTITRALVGLVLAFALVAGASPAFAQTSVSSTTLSAAVPNGNQLFVIVASATGIEVNDLLFVDREAMRVESISGTRINVLRGQEGTAGRNHGANAIVYHGPSAQFARDEVSSGAACTASAQPYSPTIVLPSGNIYSCVGSQWLRIGGDVGAVYVTCRTLLAADSIDQSCFIADRDYVIVKITEVHTTAESAGTLTLIPRRQQGTEAAASGDALATAIDMVGAGAVAQTVKTATLTTTVADLLLDAGDRLGLDFTDDVAGELAGVTVTFTLIPR